MAPSIWDERAERYRDSDAHRSGEDLDLMIGLCEPGEGVRALDVATGGVMSQTACALLAVM